MTMTETKPLDAKVWALRQRMSNAYRLAAIVPHETDDPEADTLASAVADLADELARVG